MPNSAGRRLTPEERPEDYEVSRNPNRPENEYGAVGGAIGGRIRDDNGLSFRHFLQPHSDVVPLPPPTRGRGSRASHSAGPGGVDLVDVTMGLPDFVQDHLIMESLASGDLVEASPTRQHSHSLDFQVLNEMLPEYETSQGNSQSSSRRHERLGAEEPTAHEDLGVSHVSSSALPDFLSDGPMQLNHNEASVLKLPSGSNERNNRHRDRHLENHEEPVRGPSFESTDSRSELERLRNELLEKNSRIVQLESEVSRLRSSNITLDSAVKSKDRIIQEVEEKNKLQRIEIENLQKTLARCSKMNGYDGGVGNGSNAYESQLDNSRIFQIASSSETLLGELKKYMEELKVVVSVRETEDRSAEEPRSSHSNSKGKFKASD